MRLLGYRIYYYCWKTFLLATFHASRDTATMHHQAMPSKLFAEKKTEDTTAKPQEACHAGPPRPA